MESKNEEKEILLPHHEQQSLCTTRLPYRQGRKLTAVKVYTINNESNHLLIFGVPSLNLRQEAKTLFSKFGKLLQFNISKEHAAEVFTETYHAVFEKIQSARIAKKMLDTKNFYGGSLHVCYAPEMENISETRGKLMQRQKDVIFRLKNLQKELNKPIVIQEVVEKAPETVMGPSQHMKLNMGDVNIIDVENNTVKRRKKEIVREKRFKPCFVSESNVKSNKKYDNKFEQSTMLSNNDFRYNDNIEIVDCTSANLDTVTNINEVLSDNLDTSEQTNVNDHLNYSNFGNEIVKKVPTKSVNKIKFTVNNKR